MVLVLRVIEIPTHALKASALVESSSAAAAATAPGMAESIVVCMRRACTSTSTAMSRASIEVSRLASAEAYEAASSPGASLE